MGYTYEDFEKKATDAGLMGQFSQYDLDTARQYPEFGLSILGLKQDYASATTPEQKLLINEAANQIRNSFGSYSGGGDGSKYLYNGTKTDSLLDKVTGYAPYTSRNDGASQGILDQIGSFGSFSYDKAAPTYSNAYAQQQQSLLDSIVNRPDFSWSKEEDPQWSSYKKSYLREGERATADALGQASAASGGRPSSYAVNAATQAGDYYATKLNDVIPTLYQQAYERYLKDFQMQQQALDAVNQQEQLDYNKYLTELGQYNTDRNFDYQAYLDDFSRLQSQLGAYQSAEQMDRDLYQMGLDNLISQYSAAAGREDTLYGRTWQEQALALEQAAQQKSFYQQQLDAMLAAGASPSAEMIAGSGYANEYVQAMENYYKQQQLAASAAGSSGGSRGGNGNSGGNTGDSGGGNIYQQLYNSGVRTEGDAYAALLAMGYNATQAKALTAYFMDAVESMRPQSGGTDYWQLSSPSTWQKSGGKSGGSGTGGNSGGQKPMTYTDSDVTGMKNTVNIGADGQERVVVEGFGALTLDELMKRVNTGQIIEDRDPATGRYRYQRRW